MRRTKGASESAVPCASHAHGRGLAVTSDCWRQCAMSSTCDIAMTDKGFLVIPGIHGQKEPEVGVWLDDPGTAIDVTAFIQEQLASRLQQGIQPIQHSRVAKVGIFQQHPGAVLNGPCQGPVHPLKSAGGMSNGEPIKHSQLALE